MVIASQHTTSRLAIDLKQVNRVLLQPHWRQQQDVPDLP